MLICVNNNHDSSKLLILKRNLLCKLINFDNRYVYDAIFSNSLFIQKSCLKGALPCARLVIGKTQSVVHNLVNLHSM